MEGHTHLLLLLMAEVTKIRTELMSSGTRTTGESREALRLPLTDLDEYSDFKRRISDATYNASVVS